MKRWALGGDHWLRFPFNIVARAQDRSWHTSEVFGAAATPSDYRVTFTVPTNRSACLFMTLSGRRALVRFDEPNIALPDVRQNAGPDGERVQITRERDENWSAGLRGGDRQR